MKLAIAAVHDDNYKEFAQTTLYSSHKGYCDRYGYDLLVKDKDFELDLGFEGIKYLLEILPNYDWIWFVGVDTLVMNHTIRIEDKIDDKYSFIIGADPNGPNAHSFLVKNSKEGLAWLNFIWDKRIEYANDDWKENRVVHHYYHQDPWKNSIKVYPQRYLNSYAYFWLARKFQNWADFWVRDSRCAEGDFQEGDWLLHMPGTDLATRAAIIEEFKNKVVK